MNCERLVRMKVGDLRALLRQTDRGAKGVAKMTKPQLIGKLTRGGGARRAPAPAPAPVVRLPDGRPMMTGPRPTLGRPIFDRRRAGGGEMARPKIPRPRLVIPRTSSARSMPGTPATRSLKTPATPTPRKKTPTPKMKTPTPKTKTPTPKPKTPTPKPKTPTPRQKTPTPKPKPKPKGRKVQTPSVNRNFIPRPASPIDFGTPPTRKPKTPAKPASPTPNQKARNMVISSIGSMLNDKNKINTLMLSPKKVWADLDADPDSMSENKSEGEVKDIIQMIKVIAEGGAFKTASRREFALVKIAELGWELKNKPNKYKGARQKMKKAGYI